jgi:hypothetical protein
VFVNRDIDVNRAQVLRVFLQKTIYERTPGVARKLLPDLPLASLKSAWDRYIVAPMLGVLDFDDPVSRFATIGRTLPEADTERRDVQWHNRYLTRQGLSQRPRQNCVGAENKDSRQGAGPGLHDRDVAHGAGVSRILRS